MYLEIFGKQLPLYGLLFYIGVALAAGVAFFICKKKKLERFDLAGSAVYTMIGALIGSKLLFLIVSWDEIIALKVDYGFPTGAILESIIKGGFVFYGGLIFGALGLLVYTIQFKMKLSQFADIYCTVLPLGHAFGRVGCFHGGCCYGIPYDGPLSYTYKFPIGVSFTVDNVPRLPVQLIEACCLLVLFAILMVVYFKAKKSFMCLWTYALCYSVIRFVLEFFRGDKERGGFLGISTSQWISLIIFAAALTKIIYDVVKDKKALKSARESAEEN